MLVFKLRWKIAEKIIFRSLSSQSTGLPDWVAIAKTIEELFFIPLQDAALEYVDNDGDCIVMSSQVELANYYLSPSFYHLCREGVVNEKHGDYSMRCTMSLKVVNLAELRRYMQIRMRVSSFADMSVII
jgi:hypothetical protein